MRTVKLFLILAVALTAVAAPPNEERDRQRDGLSSYFVPPILFHDGGAPGESRQLVDIKVRPDGSVAEARAVPNRDPWVEDNVRQWVFTPFKSSHSHWYTVTLVFERDEDISLTPSEKPSIAVRYESPLTLHLWRRLPLVLRHVRVDGKIPEMRCPVHGEVMTIELVPYGASGMPLQVPPTALDLEYQKAWEQFPYSTEGASSGCMVTEMKKAEAYICASCRRLKTAWFAAHPGYRPQ